MYSSEEHARARLDEAIKENAEPIARAFLDGDVAVLFVDVGHGPEDMRAGAEEGARALGWRGRAVEVGRMTKTRAARLASVIERIAPGDKAAAWLRRRSGRRIYVCMNVGTLCVEHVAGQGFVIAPGTQDHEWLT